MCVLVCMCRSGFVLFCPVSIQVLKSPPFIFTTLIISSQQTMLGGDRNSTYQYPIVLLIKFVGFCFEILQVLVAIFLLFLHHLNNFPNMDNVLQFLLAQKLLFECEVCIEILPNDINLHFTCQVLFVCVLQVFRFGQVIFLPFFYHLNNYNIEFLLIDTQCMHNS